MSVELASAYVQLVPSFRGFQSAATSQMTGISSRVGASAGKTLSAGLGSSLLRGIGTVGKAAGAVIGGGLAASAAGIGGIALSKGLSRALNIQDSVAKLEGLGHSAQAVTGIMNNALASVKGTAFGLDQAATVAASAVAAGIKPGQQLTGYLKTTADAATIAGTSLSDMGGIFNQVQASGHVYTDTLNQLSNRGIPVFSYLQKAYGVSADKLSAMVQKGQVDSKTFFNVLQKNLGGAALQSGQTARGAFANVGAALSRLGVEFGAGAAVAAAPKLFTSIGNAVDRAGIAFKPFAAVISSTVSGAMTHLAGVIDKIDFSKIASQVAGFLAQLRGGGLSKAFASFKVPSLGGVGSAFSSIGGMIRPLLPLFTKLAQGLGSIGGSIGDVITSGMPVLAHGLDLVSHGLKFIAANPQVLAPLVAGLVGAAVASRTLGQLAVIIGGISAPIKLATALVTGFSSAVKLAELAQAAFNLVASANPVGLIVIAIAAVVTALVLFFTQTKLGRDIWAGFVSFLTSAWANIVSVATTVFTGLGSFFTTVWNGIVSYITGAINNVKNVISVVIAAIALAIRVYVTIWMTIFTTAWNVIKTVVTVAINIVSTVVSTVLNVIRGVISTVLNAIVGFFRTQFDAAHTVVSTVLHAIGTVVSTVLSTVKGVFSTVLGAISGVVSGAFKTVHKTFYDALATIQKTISDGIDKAAGFFGDIGSKILKAIGDISTLLYKSGQSIVQGLIDGISSMIKKAGSAIGKVMDTIMSFFPHSPAEQGPFSGAGWTSVFTAGTAITSQYAAGLRFGSSDVQAELDRLTNPMRYPVGVQISRATSKLPDYMRAENSGMLSSGQTVTLVDEKGDIIARLKSTATTAVRDHLENAFLAGAVY